MNLQTESRAKDFPVVRGGLPSGFYKPAIASTLVNNQGLGVGVIAAYNCYFVIIFKTIHSVFFISAPL